MVLRLDLHALFGLDGLVHTLVISPTGKDTPGVLINNENFTVHHHIVFVALEKRDSLQGVVEERDEWRVRRFIQVFNT